MTTPTDEWLTAPAPPADATTERLMKHEWGWHGDDPDDECPACRVDRGIALLDERRPGWWEDVDVRKLEMASCYLCVLGQTGSSYAEEFLALGLSGDDDAVGYGFEAVDNEPDDWDILTAIWRRRISERRAR